MQTEASRPRVAEAPVLQKVLPLVTGLVVLGHLTYLLAEGSENLRFIQAGAVVGIVAFAATFVDLVLGLACLIVCVALSPEISVAGIRNLRLEDFALPGLLVAWLARAAQRREPIVLGGLGRPALALLAAMLASTLLGLASGTTAPTAAATLLAKEIEYFLVFLVVANGLRTEGEFRALAVFSILAAVASTVLSGDAAFTGVGADTRLQGPHGETANIFGGYLVIHLALAVGLYLHAGTFGGQFAAGGAIVLLGAGLLLTYSRTSYVALSAALVLYGVLRERRLLVIAVVIGAFFPLLAPDTVLTRVSTIGELATGPGPSSYVSRTAAWSWELGLLTPGQWLLGKGVGSVPFGWVDSEYVRIILDTGLAGLAAFAWLILALLRRADVLSRAASRAGFVRGYAAGYLIAASALSIHALAATSFTAIRSMQAFMILSGLLAAADARRGEWEGEPEPPIPR
jgi:hypothetical protein